MAVEIKPANRHSLTPLFAPCRYDRVLIDSVLEGHFGSAHADSAGAPAVARLDSGAFTILAGDPAAPAARDLLRLAPISYVTPQTDGWRRLLQDEFGPCISTLTFTDFSAVSLDPAHLASLVQTLPAGFELRRIDRAYLQHLPMEMGNEYFFENFWSADDFLARAMGYCVRHAGRSVCAATAMARSIGAVDIEIETAPEFQQRGLGTVAGGRLLLHCLEEGIEPRWLAANAASEALALKLGYTRGETYETFEIE